MEVLSIDHDYINGGGSETGNLDIKDSSRSAQHTGRRVYLVVAVSFGVLCILQVTLMVSLRLIPYYTSRNNQLQTYNNVTKERDQLQTSYNTLRKERDRLQTSYNTLRKERDQLQTTYNMLTKEKHQLQLNYNNLTKERDQLQTSYNTLTKERDQLQTSYNTLTKERDQLQTSYNTLTKEINLSCPTLWERFGCKCYYMSRVSKNWNDSRQDCLDRGADLVIVNSREEQDFIKVFGNRTWIGLINRNVEKTWRWVDGTSLTTGYWNTGEPNNSGGIEGCVEIMMTDAEPEMAWNDAPCTKPKRYVCEKQAHCEK